MMLSKAIFFIYIVNSINNVLLLSIMLSLFILIINNACDMIPIYNTGKLVSIFLKFETNSLSFVFSLITRSK